MSDQTTALNDEGIDDLSLQKIAQSVITLAAKNDIMIGTAESCTGGWIGKILTDCSGASDSFSGGIISYSNAVKTSVLGVSQSDLDQFGAVSRQVAKSMAEGAQKTLGVDIAVSVTGIAGPNGGSVEKPVGMVCFGLCVKGQIPTSQTIIFKDEGRDYIRRYTVKTALELIKQAIEQSIK